MHIWVINPQHLQESLKSFLSINHFYHCTHLISLHFQSKNSNKWHLGLQKDCYCTLGSKCGTEKIILKDTTFEALIIVYFF